MRREIIPPEKYVEKALIDEIFSSTKGKYSQLNKVMPRYFKILQKNLMDSITVKLPKEEEKNKKTKDQTLQLKLSKTDENWHKIYNYEHNLFSNKMGLKRYSGKLFPYRKNKREVLSSFGFRMTNKDFSDVTSNINYLLERNQKLIMKEKNFVDGFDFPNKVDLNSNIFNRKLYSSRVGFYGRKGEIPLIYESSFTHKNKYISKSEKSRHENLLNELNKLKFYLNQQPKNKLSIMKDFFLKFNINDLNKYSNEKLLKISEIIASTEPNELLKLIKPGKNAKEMVYHILDINTDINQNKKTYRKIDLSKTKYKQKSQNNLIKNRKFFGVFDTNSHLKYVENQNSLHKPAKDYSHNLDLIINDIGKEIKMLKDSIANEKESNEKEKENKNNNYFFITQHKNRTLSYNDINDKKPLTNNHKGTFLFYRKSLTKNRTNFKDIKDIKKCNFCLVAKKKNYKLDFKDKLINYEQNKKKSNLKDVIQRLYYKYNLKKLGFKEVKRTKKLTEFIAFNLALKKSRTKNFEDILNPVRKNNSYNP